MGSLELEMERIKRSGDKYAIYVAKMPGPSVDVAASLEILMQLLNPSDKNFDHLPKKLKAKIEWEDH